MVWFLIGVVAKLARRWLCTPVIVGSTPTDSIKVERGSLNDERGMERDCLSSPFSVQTSSLNFAGVAQTVRERSPGTTEAVSSTLTTGS